MCSRAAFVAWRVAHLSRALRLRGGFLCVRGGLGHRRDGGRRDGGGALNLAHVGVGEHGGHGVGGAESQRCEGTIHSFYNPTYVYMLKENGRRGFKQRLILSVSFYGKGN